jgi:glutamate/tyrosine decarboxylase-like PLP-dependent enzyme
MFGSVDNIEGIGAYLKSEAFLLRFIYPFTDSESKMNFKNDLVSSITVDGHKMPLSPYVTDIFLCRKDLMNHVQTEDSNHATR